MTSNILINELINYTQRISEEIGINLKELRFSRYYKPAYLPENPYTQEPLILIPKEFL